MRAGIGDLRTVRFNEARTSSGRKGRLEEHGSYENTEGVKGMESLGKVKPPGWGGEAMR